MIATHSTTGATLTLWLTPFLGLDLRALGFQCPVLTPFAFVKRVTDTEFLSWNKIREKEEKMLNEVILTTTACFAVVAFMALICGEMRLLQKTSEQM